MNFINRSRHTEAVKHLALASERIRQGANILAFPERTCSKPSSTATSATSAK